MKRSRAPGIILAIIAAAVTLKVASDSRPETTVVRFSEDRLPPAWKPEVVSTFEALPVKDDGRTKSLFTYAHYELLRNRAIAGVRLAMEGGEKGATSYSPVEWLLHAIFHPELANDWPVFNVEDSDALLQVGLTPHGKRRDKYSYNELKPAREQLFAARQRISAIPKPDKKSRLDAQLENLAVNVIRYEALTNYLRFAREGVRIPETWSHEPLRDRAGQTIPLSDFLEATVSSQAFQDFRQGRASLPDDMVNLLEETDLLIRDASTLLIFPPPEKGSEEWTPAGGLIRDYLTGGSHQATALADLRRLESLAKLARDPGANADFQAELKAFGDELIARARTVDAYGDVTLDRAYLKASLFGWSKWILLILFLVLALSWLAPGSRWNRVLSRVAFAGTVAAYGLILAGIAWRVRITGWGPVTNLYETIPYITLMAGVFALVLEAIFRNRIPLIVAVVSGVAGMFLAGRYEAGEATDTMGSLLAVLRSNYWLWTHVTTINLGYATVMLAAIFSMVYILCRLFDITRQDKALFRMLTQCSYGILCFGLFFSLIGTVLGGIWGNDSWGRFWGWDPKENGALLIVLWCLAVMHMRLAGWIREFGLHICTAFSANFCLFSWWHVNLLNVGLHSYGFTHGLETRLYTAYVIVSLVVLLGVVVKILEDVARKQSGGPAERERLNENRSTALPDGGGA